MFYQFIPVFIKKSVLSGTENQVPVVIYGIHGAWMCTTPYRSVPRILKIKPAFLDSRLAIGRILIARTFGERTLDVGALIRMVAKTSVSNI
eukprot:SAG11_NODE_522_length_8776_cov_6.087242_10_plen_91_part_00